ncbi:MAG: hypothetical protein AMS21_12265 [Gemmatimonas sp. SG8_38_2]|nr:MAG: hypothetical protein AMS21_12265 [Gemmatimonas sp. SG8_38_2]
MRLWRTVALALVLAVAAASPALGQLRGGLLAGATYSKPTGNFVVQSEWDLGWAAGGYLELLYTEHYSFVLELSYVTKGGKGLTENGQNFSLSLGYVEVPLLANYNASFGETWGGGFYGGLMFGAGINCDLNIEGSNIDCDTGLSTRRNEWAIPVGGRLDYKLAGGSSLMLDVRSAFPLTNAFEAQDLKILAFQFMGRWSTNL